MLVEAFASLMDLDVFLAIVGPDDGQLAEVKGLVDKFCLNDRVAFPGMLVGDDVLAAFRDADIFVLPCRTDTFPMTIIEACSTGTPMVITEGCEIAHLVKDRVAEVTPFDSQAFANGMRSLLLDKGKYERYKANCPAVLEDSFSLERAVDILESLYQRVLSDNHGH
jgi:glycosyltransferase involved in cell wall biosynthesis